ncbi:hypothetical protein HC023_01520 [Streptomyces sp. NEAU-H3]|nr:hypothetical protein [Streptomyces sp. NEAU-H3]
MRDPRGLPTPRRGPRPRDHSGSVLLDDGTPVPFDGAAFLAGGLRLLRPGQRVRIETEGEAAGLRVTLVTLQTF